MPAGKQQIIRAKLGLVDKRTPDDDLIFQLNPNHISRSVADRYADSPVAGADYSPGSAVGNPPPFQWTSNRAESIRLSFLMVPAASLQAAVNFIPFGGGLELDIEVDLAKLDRFRQKDPRTGEPPDLVFSFGRRVDRVRIFSKDVEERLWTTQLAVSQANVHLTLWTLRPRST